MCAEEPADLQKTIEIITQEQDSLRQATLDPLFANEEEYQKFAERHASHQVEKHKEDNYSGEGYLGIDSGSTTLKVVLTDPEGAVVFSSYQSNQGRPSEVVKDALIEMYSKHP